MQILVVGSIALDSVETPFGKIEEGLGGSATHFSTSASFLSPPYLVGVVGQDFPQQHLDFLASRGVHLEGLQKKEGKTFRWKGRYEFDLNTAHTLDTQLNVFLSFYPELPSSYRNKEIVFLANIDPELQMKVIEQAQNPKLIALDTMNFWISSKKEALIKTLNKVNLMFINEGEARELTGESNLVKAARKIRSWGPQTIALKRGEYGALLFHGDEIFSAPGLPLEEIKDPTGAGDSFAGGFLGYLAKSGDLSFNNLKKATIYGSVMASFNVEDFSLDRFRRLKNEEIEMRYQEFMKLAHF
ncbi:MAG: sugar kinase [Deltaproteobacteria bacterium]|nr:sugar kinase [Deltaproteobacteria bacterium]